MKIATAFAYSCTVGTADILQRVTELLQPHTCTVAGGAEDEQRHSTFPPDYHPAKPSWVMRSGMGLPNGCPWGLVCAGQLVLAGSWGWRSQPGECSAQAFEPCHGHSSLLAGEQQSKESVPATPAMGWCKCHSQKQAKKELDEFLGEIPTCNHSHAWL